MSFNFRSWITQGISDLPDKELRKLYSQTRASVIRRQEAMSRSDMAGTVQGREAVEFKTYKLSDLGSRSEIENELQSLRGFMEKKTTSVRGLKGVRAQTVRELHKHGYSWVNKGNLDQFGAFMEEWRKNFPSKEGSPTPEELKAYRKAFKNLSPEEIHERFNEFMEL